MARKGITGLYERNGIWHIDKVINGHRLQESSGSGSRQEAEQYLIHRMEGLRQEKIYGVRQTRTFREAATRFLQEVSDQPSISLTALFLEQLDPFIGDLPLTHVDDESLQPFIAWMKKGGQHPDGKRKKPVSNRTINLALQRAKRVLYVCHRKWRDEQKRPWLDAVPSITMMDEAKTNRLPYPLSWDEQRILFAELPDRLKSMALFKVNTGLREQEVCKLSWDWEVAVPELDTSVFIIPSNFGGRTKRSGVKNRNDRVVVLNDVAKSIIDQQRKMRNTGRAKARAVVFPSRIGTFLTKMNNKNWWDARERAADRISLEYGSEVHWGFRNVRIHDLKHTFGRRLKAASVTFEDRQALLGHKSDSVTSHYSGHELRQLIEAANKVSATDNKTPTLTILRRRSA